MFTPLILFFGLTVATAVIAYWSDNLGKKLGKKRVTLLGLRPRTTATVLTISSSWLIMVFTLGALLAVVTPLRHALFRYDRERKEYLDQISAAKTSLRETQGDLSKTQNSLSTSNQQFGLSQQNLRRANQNVETARSKAQTAIKRAKQAQAGEKQAQSRARVAQERAATARQREVIARRGERDAEALKEQARRDLTGARFSLQEVRNKFNTTQNQLAFTQTQLQDVQRRLQKATLNYKKVGRLAMTSGRLAIASGREAIKLRRETIALSRQRASLQKQVKDLEAAAQIYSDAAVQLANNDVKIPVGKTFAARIIEAGESPQAVTAELRQLFAQGETAFAQTEDTAPLYEQGARLILFPLPEEGSDNTPVLHSLAQIIASNGATTSVRLVAAFNFTGEEKQIAVRFIAVPVAVAFRSGETLASDTIVGSIGDAMIFRALNNMIEFGREEAIKRKVNPPLTQDEPNFYAEDTSVRLFEALRRIKASNRPQRVRIVAAQDLSTVEPLQVRFEVEDAPLS